MAAGDPVDWEVVAYDLQRSSVDLRAGGGALRAAGIIATVLATAILSGVKAGLEQEAAKNGRDIKVQR